jgi:hypothetical protein
MDNSEFLKEQKIIFDFQDGLLKEKINNKIKHPAEVLIKHNVKEDDYGIDNSSFIKRKKDNSDIKNLLEANPDYYYDYLEYYYFYNIKDMVSKKFKNSGKCKYFEAYKNNNFSRFNHICDIVLDIVEENN